MDETMPQASSPSSNTASGSAGTVEPPKPSPQRVEEKKAPAPQVKKPKQDKPPENDPGIWRISRRNFFSVAGWASFFIFIATSTVGALRYMFPRVLFEPPSTFKAGFPQDYLIGEVSEKYKDEYRVWIVRDPDGFYALSAICTHLGCTPRWLALENKFKCPCHGSGFRRSGVNFEGPAPRPLERLKIEFAPDGQILVDRNVKFLFEKGEWSRPDAFLRYS